MIDFISQDWPWYVAGPLIALVMLLLIYFNGNFGFSSNLRTACSILGAGKNNSFFNIDIKAQRWNLVFVLGSVIGGYIAFNFLSVDHTVNISQATQMRLADLGISYDQNSYLPPEIYSTETLFTFKGLAILLIAGILVGFGTRYAGGCTSGHAISGLSNFQLPSLIATIGFFVGGLIMTHLILPLLF